MDVISLCGWMVEAVFRICVRASRRRRRGLCEDMYGWTEGDGETKCNDTVYDTSKQFSGNIDHEPLRIGSGSSILVQAVFIHADCFPRIMGTGSGREQRRMCASAFT